MNAFIDFVIHCKAEINAHLEKQMIGFRKHYANHGRWAKDALKRIQQYTAQGKMIRGSLAILTGNGYGNNQISSAILDIALAMELLQSFLLIHDDMMDRDQIRRGQMSMHAQYATYGEKIPLSSERTHYGNAMAICCGDIAFALAGLQIDFALRNAQFLPVSTRSKIIDLYNGEVIRVGSAQMDDITYSSIATEEPTPQQILDLYRNKTGYYSIVLPLTLGALLAEQYQELALLEQIGCLLGEIFQIRDDLLGLDRNIDKNIETTKKSMASDIVNKKRTYARQLVVGTENHDALNELNQLESDKITERERVARYRALLDQTGVREQIEEHISAKTTDALNLINQLHLCRSTERKLLRAFCSYNSQNRE